MEKEKIDYLKKIKDLVEFESELPKRERRVHKFTPNGKYYYYKKKK